MVILSLVGLLRMLLIILGVFMLLRFIGKVMVAKRNLEAQELLKKRTEQSDDMVRKAQQNFGKTSISNVRKDSYKDEDFTDFEELD